MIGLMNPKLIIINGPLGSGKSTLAKYYADKQPLTLVLDLDEVWAMISHWREKKEITSPLSRQMALEMARINLQEKNDVIVPQIIQTAELADSFQHLAKECHADYYEILLTIEKEESIKRFIERGKSQGHPTGFRAGGIIDSSGREKKLREMYERMENVATSRPDTIKIEPVFGDIEQTYQALIEQINKS